MQRALPLALLAALALGGLGCDPDDCADLPASFHLDIEIEDKGMPTEISLLRVEIETPDARWRRYFEVGDAFSDDKTSIGVELDPAPTEEIDVVFRVAAFITTSTATPPVDEVEDEFDLEPNGCNRVRVELDV